MCHGYVPSLFLRLCRRLRLGPGLRLGLAFPRCSLGSNGSRAGRFGLLLFRLSAIGEDLGDLERSQTLAMAVAAPIMMAAALLENDDGVAALLAQDLRGNRHAGQKRTADLDTFIARQQKNLAKLDDVPWRTGNFLYGYDIVGGDAVLLAARLDDCVHDDSFFLPAPVGAAQPEGRRTFALLDILEPGAAHWRTGKPDASGPHI